MLTRAMRQTAPPRCPSSLSFSLPNKSNYLTSWTKKFWDEHQTPLKGFHLLREFLSPNPFIPKYSFPTWLVKRASLWTPQAQRKEVCFTSHNLHYLICVNKLTMLSAGALNSRSNSLKPGVVIQTLPTRRWPRM